MNFPFSSLKSIFVKHHCLPEQLVFFITNRCNMRCRHCFYWKNLNTFPDPSLDEIKKISNNIGRFNFLTLTGGEPFLREDLCQIATMFAQNNALYRISIPTNGYLTSSIVTTVRNILQNVKNCKILVKVSFDGYGLQHDSIRQKKGSFQNAVSTFQELKQLEKDYKNFTAGIIMTICNINQDYITQAYQRINQELHSWHTAVNLIRGQVKEDFLKNVDLQKYLELTGLVLKDFNNTGHISFQDAFYWAYKRQLYRTVSEVITRENFFLPCYAGRLFGVINSDLEVYPCELLNTSFGNLRDCDYEFKKIWFSPEASKINKQISDIKCVCTSECNLQINMFFNFKLVVKLLLSLISYKLGYHENCIR